MNRIILIIQTLAASALIVPAADLNQSNSVPDTMILLDSLGRAVQVSTNEVSFKLQPPTEIGRKHQTPDPIEGINVPDEVEQRLKENRADQKPFQFFPGIRPQLMPYLASFDERGNSALRPGALTPFVPLEQIVQGGKYRLSAYGLRYSLVQTLTYLTMTDVQKGENSLSYYTLDLKTKWAVFDAIGADTAGWVTAQVEAKTGLDPVGNTQDAKSNLGSLTDPTGIWSSVQGFRLPELAWQESFRHGEIVVVAGIISQRNYLDGNVAAHTGRGEFINSALIHSQVMPLSQYNPALNLQWQPLDEFYAMLGASAGNTPAGQVAWNDFSWKYWSLVGEFGYAPKDFLGLGGGVYRFQPFIARAGGPTQPGVCFNFQQFLGPRSPFAWFGRVGFGGSKVSADASAQAGTGFAMHAPLKHAGLVEKLSNDLLGIGFIWSQPSSTTKTVYHENELGLETFYALQLTPTIKLQPDLQIIWDPVFNRDSGPATVAQVQLNLAW